MNDMILIETDDEIKERAEEIFYCRPRAMLDAISDSGDELATAIWSLIEDSMNEELKAKLMRAATVAAETEIDKYAELKTPALLNRAADIDADNYARAA